MRSCVGPEKGGDRVRVEASRRYAPKFFYRYPRFPGYWDVVDRGQKFTPNFTILF